VISNPLNPPHQLTQSNTYMYHRLTGFVNYAMVSTALHEKSMFSEPCDLSVRNKMFLAEVWLNILGCSS